MKKRSIHAAIKNLDGLGDVRKHVKKHALLVLLVGAMVAGMVVGAVTARQADDNLLRTLDFLFNGNYQARAEQTMASTFAASLASSFVFVLLCALMGLSLWGGIPGSGGAVFQRFWLWIDSRVLMRFLFMERIGVLRLRDASGDVPFRNCHGIGS